MQYGDFGGRSGDGRSRKVEVPSQACYVAVGADYKFAS
jgi:hypothetical protein